MSKLFTIIDFVTSKDWLGDTTMSPAQLSILKAIYGLPMSRAESKEFLSMTEGRKPNLKGYSEATLCCGQRSGKTERIAANIATYEAVTFDPRKLARGEVAYVALTAQDKVGAMEARNYIEGKLLHLEERYKILDTGDGQERAITLKEIRLKNRVRIICLPCTKASVRGKTVLCAICDEIGFWQTETDAYNADYEVLRALRPARATIGRAAKLIKISSPFLESGVLYDDYEVRNTARRLFAVATTEQMNPSITKEFLEDAQEDDPEGYSREYGAQFGKQGGTFLSPELVDKAMDADRPQQLAPQRGMEYFAHIDAAFKIDLFVLGVGHLAAAENKVVFDLLKWWRGKSKAPLDSHETVLEIVNDISVYGIDVLTGDQFSDVPLMNDFRTQGISFRVENQSAITNTEQYKNLKAVLRRGQIELPKDSMIRSDLTSLVAKRKTGGLWHIAAPPRRGAHDDISKVISVLTMKLLPLQHTIDINAVNRQGMPVDNRFRYSWQRPQVHEMDDSWENDIMGAKF